MASFKIFVLCLFLLAVTVQVVRSVDNPEIKRCFSDESDPAKVMKDCKFEIILDVQLVKEFENHTANVFDLKDANTTFLYLQCQAAYPIQWLTHKPVGDITYTKYEYRNVTPTFEKDRNESSTFEYIQHIQIPLRSNFSRKLRCERFGRSRPAVEIFLNLPETNDSVTFEMAGSGYFLGTADKTKSVIIPCAAKSIGNTYTSALTKRNTNSEIFSTKCAICTCFGSSECPNNTFPCFSSNVCGSLAMSIWDNDTNPIDEYLECIRNFGCITCTIRSHMRKFPFEGKDCDGDGVLTCHDYARTYLLGEENCNKDLQPQQKDIFERFENCYNDAEENYTIIGKPEYDPTVGFRIEEQFDFESMYECSSKLHNVFYITPLDRGRETRAKITIEPPIPTATDKVQILCHPNLEVQNLNLQIASCNSISECDFQFQPVEPYINFIEKSEDKKKLQQIFSLNDTEKVKPNFSHGFVQCSALYRPQDNHNVFGYVYQVAYIFKGIDGSTRLFSKGENVPNSKVISIQQEDEREQIEDQTHKFVCEISTFVLLKFVHFEIKTKGEAGTSRQKSANVGILDEKTLIQKFTLELKLTRSMEEVICLSPTIIPNENFARATLKLNVNEKPLDPLIIVGIVAAIILFIAMAISIAFFWIQYLKSKAALRNLTKYEVDAFFQGDKSQAHGENDEVNIEALGFSKEKWIPSEKLVTLTEDKLGEGEFGLVCKGEMEGNCVAVKSTKPKADVEYFKAFLTEIKVINFIGHHENIVKFHGAVVDKIEERICFAVFELSPFGNLNDYLKKYAPNYVGDNSMKVQQKNVQVPESDGEPHIQITQSILISFCKQIASGMAYLSEKKVIHGDLATRNVLVFPNNVVKVTDFGLSRKLYECQNYVKSKQAPLPWRWMALESLQNWQYSSQSDVWSLAVTAWEIFSFSQVPFSGLTWNPEFADAIENGLRLPKPQQALVEVYQWMLSCWENEPDKRPTLFACKGFFINLEAKINKEKTGIDDQYSYC